MTNNQALDYIHNLFNQERDIEAIQQLDILFKEYAEQKQLNFMAQVLESLVESYPQNRALRMRLASLYRRINRKQDAIIQLSILGIPDSDDSSNLQG